MPDPPPPWLLGPSTRAGRLRHSFFERVLRVSRRTASRALRRNGTDRLGLPVAGCATGRPVTEACIRQRCIADQRQDGALCEAIEAHCAAPFSPTALCAGLPSAAIRAGAKRSATTARPNESTESEETLQWCSAPISQRGSPNICPTTDFDDYTRGLRAFRAGQQRSRSGPSEADALRISLFEVIERDAVGNGSAWLRPGAGRRQSNSIAFPSNGSSRGEPASDRSTLSCSLRVASIVGVPVFTCVIGGVEEFGPAYRRFMEPRRMATEVALFKALAEAIQSRLTLIAGVRDHSASYMRALGEASAEQRVGRSSDLGQIEPMAGRLDAIADVGRAGLSADRRKAPRRRPGRVAVTQVFVPGLGSSTERAGCQ